MSSRHHGTQGAADRGQELVVDIGLALVEAAISRHRSFYISLRAVATALIAASRFRSSKLKQHNAPQQLKLSISEFRFHPQLVASLASLVKNRDAHTLQQLGGLPGLASHLRTDLGRGIHLIKLHASPTSAPDIEDVDPTIAERKLVFGQNVYPRKIGKTFLGYLWEACNDFTLIILVLCAALSLAFGIKSEGLKEGWYDGGSIGFAVALVVAVTALSNYRQSRQFRRLAEERGHIQVHVVRGGRTMPVPIQDIVVGDMVELGIGDQVPADGLLVQAHSLAIDESSFTGENDYFHPDLVDQPFLRSGSKVQDGTGIMLVTSVGINTEWGSMMAFLSTSSGTADEQTPLQARLTKVAKLIGFVGLSVALVVLVVLLVFYFTGHSGADATTPKFQAGQTKAIDVMNALVHIFSIVVTIVVVAVPEGLPLAVTLTLAYSMRKMMADNALVRRLAACETMGSATTICSDKTGTLTVNQMTVVKAWVAGQESAMPANEADEQGEPSNLVSRLSAQLRSLLFQGIAQNTMGSVFQLLPSSPSSSSNLHDSASWQLSKQQEQVVELTGSPTEKAILMWGLRAGMDFQQVRAESETVQVETFNSAKKRAGVIVRSHLGHKLLVHWKGAAEIILSMCDKWMDIDGEHAAIGRPITDQKRQELEAMIDCMAASSLRCVALAYCDLTEKCNTSMEDCALPEIGLTLLAVVGMKDPCRPGVKVAVKAVKAAGVKVRMVTGDSLATAKAIARECGIWEEVTQQEALVVDGNTFRSWTESERQKNLPSVAVLARALPADKLLLVETLQSMGEVVAVTGDGTNDAPALHKADIGLSMGIQGTEVAKESSDIIILDDNFTSIVNVVRWGRSICFNIQKFLQFQLTVNVSALAINFVAAVTSGDVPLTAVQLLWVNLIMDTLGALALATEPPTDELMAQPPVGRQESLITHAMWRNIAFQATYQVAILLTLQFRGETILGLSGTPDAAIINRTVIFNTFVLCQLFNEVNARQPYRWNIFHGLLNNHCFLGIEAITLILQVVMVEFLERFASTVRLDWQHWLVCIGLAFLSWPIGVLA